MIVMVRSLDNGRISYFCKTYAKLESAVKGLERFGNKPNVKIRSNQVWEATVLFEGKPIIWHLVDIDNDIRGIIQKAGGKI